MFKLKSLIRVPNAVRLNFWNSGFKKSLAYGHWLKTGLALFCCLMCGVSVSAERPNVLFICIDDLRPELGCYGSPQVIAPNIDKLASDGLRFDRAYCQVPICMGSRANLMTGILPTPTRFKGDCRVDVDTPGVATLPETFRNAGYTTISNGKIFHNRNDSAELSWSVPPWPTNYNFVQSHDPETTARRSERTQRGRFYESPDVADDAYVDGRIARKTINDLAQLKKDGQPFFLACGFIRPHLPFYAPKRYWDLYEHDKIDISTNRKRPENAPQELRGSGEYRNYYFADLEDGSEAFHRMMRHGYLASTSYVDKLVGDVLAELERLELADNTIVVLWGDHGFLLGEYDFWGKHNTMHLATRIPLIIKVPNKNAGATSSLVETSDIFPTLCALANLPIPATVQGKSFAELFDQPEKPFREAAYSRYLNAEAVITERFNFTSFRGGKAFMLYDLVNDPDENYNLANQPQHAETIERLKMLLEQRQREAATIPQADVPK